MKVELYDGQSSINKIECSQFWSPSLLLSIDKTPSSLSEWGLGKLKLWKLKKVHNNGCLENYFSSLLPLFDLNVLFMVANMFRPIYLNILHLVSESSLPLPCFCFWHSYVVLLRYEHSLFERFNSYQDWKSYWNWFSFLSVIWNDNFGFVNGWKPSGFHSDL